MTKGTRATATAMVVGLLTMAGQAHGANVVMEWNQLALGAT